MTEARISILKSLGLHGLIVCVLLLSVAFGDVSVPELSQPEPIIQARFIDAQAIYDKQQEEQEAARAAQQQLNRQREAQRKAEAERKKKAEAIKKRKRQRELEQKAREAAEKKRQREAQEKAEQEQREKQKAERERKQKEQQALDRLMQEQMRAEQAAQAQRRSQQVLSEVDKYSVLIKQSIQRYLIDDGSFKGKRCQLNIRLASTGLVTSVSILSGDSALCRASRSAALRPDKMPMSDDLDVYQELKDITLTVEL